MSSKKAEIIACHGWGFDASFWQPFHEQLPDAIEFKTFDRGYFGREKLPEFNQKHSVQIAVTHSFGLHLCEQTILEEADMLIIFSGFINFHPQAAQFRRRSKQILNEMINRFKDEPNKVLQAFYQNVFQPDKVDSQSRENINQKLLLEDLKILGHSKLDLSGLTKNAKVLIFHGSKDAIIPREKGRGLYKKLARQARFFEIKQGGHGLPVTHARKCCKIIKKEIVAISD